MIASRLQSFIHTHTHKCNKKFIEPENHRMYLGSIGADSGSSAGVGVVR